MTPPARVCRHGEIVPLGGSCPRCHVEKLERSRRRGTHEGTRLRWRAPGSAEAARSPRRQRADAVRPLRRAHPPRHAVRPRPRRRRPDALPRPRACGLQSRRGERRRGTEAEMTPLREHEGDWRMPVEARVREPQPVRLAWRRASRSREAAAWATVSMLLTSSTPPGQERGRSQAIGCADNADARPTVQSLPRTPPPGKHCDRIALRARTAWRKRRRPRLPPVSQRPSPAAASPSFRQGACMNALPYLPLEESPNGQVGGGHILEETNAARDPRAARRAL